MKIFIELDNPAATDRSAGRDRQYQASKIAKALGVIGDRFANGGITPMQFDLDGLHASCSIEPSPTSRHAA